MMKILLRRFSTLIVCIIMLSCGRTRVELPEPPPITKPAESIEATPDQKERRAKSEAYCTAHGVPVYSDPNSMFTDTESIVSLRTKDEVVDRALALSYIGLKGEGLSADILRKVEKKYNVRAKLSPQELAYAENPVPSEAQNINAVWRYEALHVLLWSIGYVDSLAYPEAMCNVNSDMLHIRDRTEQQFRDQAKPRSKKEILDQVDLVLRLHWACVDARINNRPSPGNLNGEIIMEWHYVLNWLIHYSDQEWDDVTTDT